MEKRRERERERSEDREGKCERLLEGRTRRSSKNRREIHKFRDTGERERGEKERSETVIAKERARNGERRIENWRRWGENLIGIRKKGV